MGLTERKQGVCNNSDLGRDQGDWARYGPTTMGVHNAHQGLGSIRVAPEGLAGPYRRVYGPYTILGLEWALVYGLKVYGSLVLKVDSFDS